MHMLWIIVRSFFHCLCCIFMLTHTNENEPFHWLWYVSCWMCIVTCFLSSLLSCELKCRLINDYFMLLCVPFRIILLLSLSLFPSMKLRYMHWNCMPHNVSFLVSNIVCIISYVDHCNQGKFLRIMTINYISYWGSYSNWCLVYLGLHTRDTPLVYRFPASSTGSIFIWSWFTEFYGKYEISMGQSC